MGPIFFHIDVNSAFLSWTAVDKLNNGATVDLREVPSIIGGDRETRHGIVTAKSIPAKRLGIETAEPVASALKKCPNLIIESPNFKLYSRMSHLFKDYLYSLTDDVEPASIDECYLHSDCASLRIARGLCGHDKARYLYTFRFHC